MGKLCDKQWNAVNAVTRAAYRVDGACGTVVKSIRLGKIKGKQWN
jgi:hypothetical protein